MASKILSIIDYRTAFRLEMLLDLQDGVGSLSVWLGLQGLANWTVCPVCRVDDFCHVEGCSLLEAEGG